MTHRRDRSCSERGPARAQLPKRFEAERLSDSSAQKGYQEQRQYPDEVHPAPAPSRIRDVSVKQSAGDYADQADRMQHRDPATSRAIGELLADHDYGDRELRRE